MNSEEQAGLQPELLDDFYTECDEHLSHIRQALVLLEQSVGKAQPDLAVVEELFRNFHSFKGISAIVGLRAAEELAHACEDFLRELTRNRVTVSTRALELLMDAGQRLEQIVAAFRQGAAAPATDQLLASLHELGGHAPKAAPEPSRTGAESSSGHDPHAQIEEARARGLLLWRCTFRPSNERHAQGVTVNSVRARLEAAGEILEATPQVRGQGDLSFEFVVATRGTPPDIAGWEAEGISVKLIEENTESNEESDIGSVDVAQSAHSPFLAPSHVVRVDLHKLDELMRLTGDLVIHRSRLEDGLAHVPQNGSASDLTALHEANAALGRALRELREAIMRVRLVPVAEIFARMPFVVRDLARGTGKQVRLTLVGEQTELDKYLVERLKDPLLHLVRNAFSHAVESPEERVQAGKPAEATIELRARTQGDAVLIQVLDDGRGIDAKAVAKRAANQGIAPPAELDDAALLQILCSPGFSTREDADRAAGRGMGMAVVFTTVRELGGTITLETKLGVGTTFTLRLPLTLAVAEMLIFSAGGQTCAIPQSYVREVMQVPSDQVRVVNRVEMVPYRSGVLPITRLTSLFKVAGAERGQLNLLVLSSDRGSRGLVVDKIHGQKEVVVQALRDPLVQVPGIVGATELGNGRPVLILDGAMLTSGAVRPHTEVDPTRGARDLA